VTMSYEHWAFKGPPGVHPVIWEWSGRNGYFDKAQYSVHEACMSFCDTDKALEGITC